MPETLVQKAARITCTACSMASGQVHITSFDPFQVNPPNLLDTTFETQHIVGAPLDIFKKAAAELISDTQPGRDDIKARILAEAIDTKGKIMLFNRFLEALFLTHEAGTR